MMRYEKQEQNKNKTTNNKQAPQKKDLIRTQTTQRFHLSIPTPMMKEVDHPHECAYYVNTICRSLFSNPLFR
jgi:hypothetical protein